MLMRNHWGKYSLKNILRACISNTDIMQPDINCALSLLVDKSKKFNQNTKEVPILRLFRKAIPNQLIDQIDLRLKDANPELYQIKEVIKQLNNTVEQENSGPALALLVDEWHNTLERLTDPHLKISSTELGILTMKIQNYQNLTLEKIDAYYIQDRIEILISRSLPLDEEVKDIDSIIQQRNEIALEVDRFRLTARGNVVTRVTDSLQALDQVIGIHQSTIKFVKQLDSSRISENKILIQKGDGNCLFRSFATALYLHAGIDLDKMPEARKNRIVGHGDELEDKYHGFLRKQAADFIEKSTRKKMKLG